MYRILLTDDKKAYATECDHEFNTKGKHCDNLFDEKIHEYMKHKCKIVICDNFDKFKDYFPDFDLNISPW